MQQRKGLFSLGLLGLALFILPACSHNRSNIVTEDLGNNNQTGLLTDPNRRSVNLPEPASLSIVKEMTASKGDGSVTGQYTYEFEQDSEGNSRVKSYIQKGLNGARELVEKGRFNFSYAGNIVTMTMVGDVTDGFSGTFELDEKGRPKIAVLFNPEAPDTIMGRIEYEYEGEMKRPSKAEFFLADEAGDIPENSLEFIWSYDARGYASRVIQRALASDDGTVIERVNQFNYDERGYLDLFEISQGDQRTDVDYNNTYDAQGILREQGRSAGERSRVVRFSYDGDGNISKRCFDEENDGRIDFCYEYQYETVSKLPLLDHLIMDPKRETIEDLESNYLTGYISK